MNKRGFTLIEIIICISMLVVIGVGSFIGIRMVNKNLTIKELKQITNKAIQASQVYIETNKEAQTQLYTEQNAVKIPLKVLVNEGLLSLKGTNLDNDKIKDEYVITALSTEPGTSTECTNIDSKASWDTDKVIYICTNLNSKGEVTGSNLATIDPTKYNNKTYVSNEPYYFKGKVPNNYVKFVNTNIICTSSLEDFDNNNSPYKYNIDNSTVIRILYIDRNDDIVVVAVPDYKYCKKGDKIFSATKTQVDIDAINSSNSSEIADSWITYSDVHHGIIISRNYSSRLRMPSSCKIKSGTGADDNPFQVEC